MGNRLGAPSRRREKPEHAALKIAMRSKQRGVESNKLPPIAPKKQCLLRLLKQNRIHDYLLLEKEFILRQNVHRPLEVQRRQERKLIHKLRGSPTCLARVHELFQDEQHAVVVIEGYKREWLVLLYRLVSARVRALIESQQIRFSYHYFFFCSRQYGCAPQQAWRHGRAAYCMLRRRAIFDTLHFVLGKLFRHPRCNQNLKKWKRPIIPSLPGFNHAFTGRKRIRGALSISPIRLVVRGMTATVCTLFSISICSNPFISGTCRSSRLWTRTSSV